MVRKASRYISGVFDEVFSPLGLQTSQVNVIISVASFGDAGVAIAPLAQSLMMERTTLTRNLRPLERAGLVQLEHSEDDARVRVVRLTLAGEVLIGKVNPLWSEALKRLRRSIGAVRMKSFEAELAAFVAVAQGLP